jgi:hypothetical protein
VRLRRFSDNGNAIFTASSVSLHRGETISMLGLKPSTSKEQDMKLAEALNGTGTIQLF